jgi:signal transduction histidine kinase
MISSRSHELFLALGDEECRACAARELALLLGADEVLLYALDPVSGVLIPALGMAQTVRGGRIWRTFLASLRTDGWHEQLVDLPLGGQRPALAHVSRGAALVLLGGVIQSNFLAELEFLLPLLALTLKAEQRLMAARAEAFSAAEVATRANALALALERARSDASLLNSQLRAEDLAKDEFLATLAHELRNPISGIRVSVSALQNAVLDRAAQTRVVAAIDRQSKQLASLVDDLLDAARIRHGRIVLQRRMLELREVLREAVELNRHVADAKEQEVHLLLDEPPILVIADQARLLQIFTNLFVNACKYTHNGGRIAVRAQRVNTWAEVEIADSGIGIDARTLPLIFELFTQAPTAIKQAQGGLGIGLSLVKRLVDLHDGTVEASSPGPGLGSTFTVRIPIADK